MIGAIQRRVPEWQPPSRERDRRDLSNTGWRWWRNIERLRTKNAWLSSVLRSFSEHRSENQSLCFLQLARRRKSQCWLPDPGRRQRLKFQQIFRIQTQGYWKTYVATVQPVGHGVLSMDCEKNLTNSWVMIKGGAMSQIPNGNNHKLTTATRVLVDFPSVPLLKLLNRWSASCASPVFARLVPPRSAEDSRSVTVNGYTFLKEMTIFRNWESKENKHIKDQDWKKHSTC